MDRTAEVSRKTGETEITVKINLDGSGKGEIATGVPFMDHMLTLFARHGFFDLEVKAKGDLEVDYHHTLEDLGLTLGMAFDKALGDRAGIRRYGNFMLPMDETLVLVALDISGRPGLFYDVTPPAPQVKDIDVRLFHEFLQAFSNKLGLNLHVKMLAAEEAHHLFEAIFKGLARALDQATGLDPRVKGIPSTKGVL